MDPWMYLWLLEDRDSDHDLPPWFDWFIVAASIALLIGVLAVIT